MAAIFRREFSSYFASPIGYIYLTVFYFFSGMFFNSVVTSNSTDVTPVFSSLSLILLILIPLLTMRLLSEEKKQKTDQLLLTSPVSLSGLVYGKFLAAFCIVCHGNRHNFCLCGGFGRVCLSSVDGGCGQCFRCVAFGLCHDFHRAFHLFPD